MSETYVPAQYAAPRQEPRFSSPHVDPSGSRHPRGAPPQGPGPSDGLTVWRLRGRRNIEAARHGRRSASGSIWVRIAPPEEDAGAPAVGYAIGRRVGSAVTRNRVRRRLRAAIVELGDEHAPGRYLVGAGPEAADQAFSALVDDLRRAIARSRA